MRKAKRKSDKGKGCLRRFVTIICACPFTLSLLHFPFPTVAFAQQPTSPDIFSSEIPDASTGRAVSPRFEKLGIEQGLSQSSILDMLQDRNGFMWFGTQDGLNRFDGYEVKIYDNVPFDTTSLLDGWSSALAEDAGGRLWVGLWSGWSAVSVMDP
ncbi:MAG: two-component regulator propeller domain-containing protein, partial [Rhodothermia bacterium]